MYKNFTAFICGSSSRILSKFLRVIKLTIVLLILTVQVSTATNAQMMRSAKSVNLTLNNEPLNNHKSIGISGKVTDKKGDPLPGVTVRVKGSSSGVSTDTDGKFSLTVPDRDAVLVFSFIGYDTREIPLNGKTQFTLTLTERSSTLNEVVVIGYGTQQRKDLVSAVSTVKGENIQNLPTATPQSLIQGRASGIQVVQNSGAPGSAATVRIRGTTSINAGNDPLYIIDGVPVESGTLSGINPSGSQTSALAAIDANDIESMEILKDAGALAIYGSRAANGVILITTKHGKKGGTTYSFNYYTGFQDDDKSRRIKMMNSTQAIELIEEGRANALDGGVTSLYGFLLPAPDGTVANTDWQAALFRTAPVSNYQMSIRGGENKLTFAISGSYLDQQGIIIASGFTRGSGRVNLDYRASDKLKFGVNTSFSRYNNKRVSTEDGPSSIIQVALKKSPSLPIYNDDGTYYQGDVSNFINPIAYANKVQDNNQVSSTVGNVYGEYKPIRDLTLRSSVGLNYASILDKFFQPSDATRNGTASGNYFSSTVDNWIIENTLNYSRTFGKHHLTALLGYSQQERSSFAIQAQGTQYATNNISTLNAANMPTQATSNQSAYGLSSAFGRVSYSYAEKYYMEGSVRRDGSSRFGAARRYAVFPALSGAWRISNESFWNKKSSLINDLKLRASLGKTGNQSIGDYVAQGQYSTGAGYAAQSGIYLSTLPNPDLTWETTMQYDGGLDISLLQSRITLGIDVYVKNTSNLLLDVPLPHTTGFTTVLKNIGATRNKGLEFNLNTINIQNKKINWNTNFNISFNRNLVTQLYSGADNIIVSTGVGATGSLTSYSIIQIGSPIGSFYGWKESGVYQYSTDNSAKITNASFGTAGYLFKGGDMIFQDTNGGGSIDNNDRMIIGNAQPKFTGGMTNTVKIKSFDLNMLLTFSYGNDVVDGTKYAAESGTGFQGDLALLNRWRNEGDLTNIPRQDYADPAGNRRFSNRWIEDGSYLRCKNLTLGYTFSNGLLNKISVKSARIFTTAQNLFTITNYSGYDPEASAFNSGVTNIGIDQGTYPQYRAFTFGINVGF